MDNKSGFESEHKHGGTTTEKEKEASTKAATESLAKRANSKTTNFVSTTNLASIPSRASMTRTKADRASSTTRTSREATTL